MSKRIVIKLGDKFENKYHLFAKSQDVSEASVETALKADLLMDYKLREKLQRLPADSAVTLTVTRWKNPLPFAEEGPFQLSGVTWSATTPPVVKAQTGADFIHLVEQLIFNYMLRYRDNKTITRLDITISPKDLAKDAAAFTKTQ